LRAVEAELEFVQLGAKVGETARRQVTFRLAGALTQDVLDVRALERQRAHLARDEPSPPPKSRGRAMAPGDEQSVETGGVRARVGWPARRDARLVERGKECYPIPWPVREACAGSAPDPRVLPNEP
jgi:hypothetical protein